MNAKMNMKRYLLSSIKDWLKLTDTPLRGAQRQMADLLKLHHDGFDNDPMVTVSDLAHAINTTLTWASHSLDVALSLLGEAELTPEKIEQFVTDNTLSHKCAWCGRVYTGSAKVTAGDTCQECWRGLLEVVVEPLEPDNTVTHKCARCGREYTGSSGVKVGGLCHCGADGVIELIVKPLRLDTSPAYACDQCASVHIMYHDLKVGDPCEHCDDGSIVVALPF